MTPDRESPRSTSPSTATTWIKVGSDPDWSYTWDTTQYADQIYMIEARATDVAGNEEHTDYLVVGVDNTNPLVDLSPEWTAPSTGDAGGSDATSGHRPKRASPLPGTGSPRGSQDYGTVPARSIGTGWTATASQAGYGDYDVMLEVWDRAGNYSVTYGVIHLLAPPPQPEPTEALPVVAAPTAMPTAAPVIEEVIPEPVLPKALPFWSLILPLGALGVWLAGSNIAHRARQALERTARDPADGRALPRSKQNQFPTGGRRMIDTSALYVIEVMFVATVILVALLAALITVGLERQRNELSRDPQADRKLGGGGPGGQAGQTRAADQRPGRDRLAQHLRRALDGRGAGDHALPDRDVRTASRRCWRARMPKGGATCFRPARRTPSAASRSPGRWPWSRSRLSKFGSNLHPLLPLSGRVETYQLSTLNCGIAFDLEAAQVWKKLTGEELKMKELWLYVLPRA